MSEHRDKPSIERVRAAGAEMIEEELVDASIDGGHWNEYAQTWETPTGFRYVYTCYGSACDDERDGYEWAETIKPHER